MNSRFLCLGCLVASTALVGQSAAPKSDAPAKFEAADVHVSPKARNQFLQGPYARNGHYEVRNATMVDLISKAYGVDFDDVWGGPTWLEMVRFDIIGKVQGSPKAEA